MKLLKALEKILPLIFWLFLIFAFDTPRLALLTIFAAVIHEAGHIAFGLSRGIVRLIPSPHPSGFRIKAEKTLSYKDEIILLLGGPVLNFIFFFIAVFLSKLLTKGSFFDFAFINLLTALSNLLPIKGYDGYRILENLFLLKGSESFKLVKILSWVSFLFTSLLCFLSLYLVLKLGEGYWIFALFFSSALVGVKKITETGVF